MPGGNSHSGGFWYAPDGNAVGFNFADVPGFRRNRGSGVVRLRRRDTDTDTPAEGIYRCTVQDASGELQSVYVGLYNSGGGVSFISEYSMTRTIAFIISSKINVTSYTSPRSFVKY